MILECKDCGIEIIKHPMTFEEIVSDIINFCKEHICRNKCYLKGK